MALEHASLTGAQLHEPKGADVASSGQIYIANGIGSGAWSNNMRTHHGDMTITSNATATAVTAAVDATLSTSTDYKQITAGWADGHLVGISRSTDKLVVSSTGHYIMSFWCSVKIPTINNYIGIKYVVNGSTYSTQKIVSQSSTANDFRNLSGTAQVMLNAGDTLAVYIAGTKNDNLIVQDAGMVLFMVHG